MTAERAWDGGRLAFGALLVGIACLALALRISPLPEEAIDGDELYTLEIAQLSFEHAILGTLEDGAHPPLHQVAAWGLVRVFGADHRPIRGLSLVAGLGLVLLGALITHRYTGSKRAALLAASLLAVSPAAIETAQQGRAYALYSLTVLAMAAALLRALELGRDRGAWMAWAAFSGLTWLAAMLHYMALLYLGAALLVVWLYPERLRNTLRFGLAALPAVVSLLAWGTAVLWVARMEGEAGVGSIDWHPVPSPGRLISVLLQPLSVPPVGNGTLATLLLAAFLCVWVGRTLFLAERSGGFPRRVTGLAGLALLPPLVLFVAAAPPLLAPVWAPRYVDPSLGLGVVLVSVALWQSPVSSSRVRSWISMGLVAWAGAAWLLTPRPVREPYDDVADYLATLVEQNPEARVLTTEWAMVGRPVRYYLRTRSTEASVPAPPVRAWEVGMRPRGATLLLHRPVVAEEQGIVDSLETAGWSVGERAHFGSRWGVTVSVLTPEHPPAVHPNNSLSANATTATVTTR